MDKIARGFFVLAFSLTCAAPAAAGALAPSKPSQLVTLSSSGGDTCAAPLGTWFKMDSQVNADASSSPFTIPPGMVLVLTQADWTDQGGTADVDRFIIRLQNGTEIPFVGDGTRTIGASAGGGSISFSPGVVVKPGTDICVTSTSTGFTAATFHGYLTKDR